VAPPTGHHELADVQDLCHFVGFGAMESSVPSLKMALISLKNPMEKSPVRLSILPY